MVIQGLSAFDKSICDSADGRVNGNHLDAPTERRVGSRKVTVLANGGWVGGRSRSAVKCSVGRGDIENVFERSGRRARARSRVSVFCVGVKLVRARREVIAICG